jgi:stage V sporulation protein SpoVS
VKKVPRNVTAPRALPPRLAENVRIPGTVVFRAFVLGAVAVGACVWAIWRHYTVPPTPMLVPKPAATEIEIEP